MRWVPVAAWIFTLVGLLLSLVTLLIGIEGSSANSAPIAKYNVSSLGLAEFHDSSSELGRNISALIPTDADTSVSITQYLGAKDWYTVHYLSICSGFFAPSKSDPSILTRSTVNVTCVRQSSGYTFSLAGILRDGLKPSVQSLVEGIDASTKSYHTAPWINLWYAGMVFAFLEAALLPFTFSGERRINMHSFFVSLISFILLDIASGLVTGHVLGIHRSGLGLYPGAFLGLTWTSTVCMIVVLCLIQVEWKFQIWTPIGEPISTYWKPKNASWFALRPPGSRKLKAYWDVRHGI